jgi:hypothetical protein
VHVIFNDSFNLMYFIASKSRDVKRKGRELTTHLCLHVLICFNSIVFNYKFTEVAFLLDMVSNAEVSTSVQDLVLS